MKYIIILFLIACNNSKEQRYENVDSAYAAYRKDSVTEKLIDSVQNYMMITESRSYDPEREHQRRVEEKLDKIIQLLENKK